MSTFKFKGRHIRIIPFLITVVTLLFLVFWIGSMAYQYHLETEERRITLNKNIFDEAKKLNSVLHEKQIKLEQEIEHLKSAPYELRRDTGEIEFYNLCTHKLVKKIDLEDNIYEYDKNNGLLLKKTDKYNNIYEYGTHGKLIKKTLPDGVWEQYNPVNEKLIKRQNIDGSIEEFDANEEKYKETDKNGKVKYFKTQIYQTVADFKKLGAEIDGLRKIGFTVKDLRYAGYTLQEFEDYFRVSDYKLRDLINKGYTPKDFKDAGYTAKDFKDAGYSFISLLNARFTYEELRKAGYTDKEIRDGGYI